MIPVIVYRVYPDGRPDELVRGADIVGTPLASFSKILATSDKPEVFNGYCGAESGSVPVSAVSPAILVSEIEIEKKAKANDRPPLLPEPTSMESNREARNENALLLRRRRPRRVWLCCPPRRLRPTPFSRPCAMRSTARANSRCPTSKRPTSSST